MKISEDLCIELQKRIAKFKELHPRLSSQQVAKLLDMSNSTLSRIENNEIKKPSIEQVLKILKGTGSTQDIYKYIKAYYPEIVTTYDSLYNTHELISTETNSCTNEKLIRNPTIEKILNHISSSEHVKDPGEYIKKYYPRLSEEFEAAFSLSSESELSESSIEEYFNKKETFLIMLLAYSRYGCPERVIQNEFGQIGKLHLDKLIKEKAVVKIGDNIESNKDKSVSFTQEGSKQLLMLVIENCYKSEGFENRPNYLNICSNSINKKLAMPKITKIMREAHTKILEVIEDKENEGSDYFFTGLIADTLLNSRK